VRGVTVSVACLLVFAAACSRGPSAKKRAELVAEGDSLAAKGNFVGAAAAYNNALKNGPADGALLMKTASTELRIGRPRLAHQHGVRAADMMPDNLDAQLLAARLMLMQRQFVDVKNRLLPVVQKNPKSVEALIELGNGSAHLQHAAAALITFSAARNKDEFDEMSLKVRFSADPREPGITSRDLEDAEQPFRKAVEIDPNHTGARIALANFLWWTGRADQAEELLKSVSDANPDSRIANLALGSYYRLTRRTADAERYLEVAAREDMAVPGVFVRDDADGSHPRELGTDAGKTTARFGLVNLYLDSKRDQQALAMLNVLSAAYPIESGLMLARVEFRTGRRDEALRRVDELLERKPPPAGATLLKAQFLLEKGEVDQAVALARATATAEPLSSEARTTLGEALVASGDIENGYDELKEALRLRPSSADAALALMTASIALKRDREAAVHARTAARLNPGNDEAALGIVKALILAQDYSGAERELAPLLGGASPSAAALAEMGNLQEARRNHDAARAAFARALQAAPDSLEALSGMLALDTRQKNLAPARQRADAALARHPKDVRYLEIAARTYAADNDAARAEAALRKVLEGDRGNVPAAVLLARTISPKSAEEATRVLRQVLERRPRSVEARDTLAGILEQMGRRADARQEYEKIKEESFVTSTREMAAYKNKATVKISALDANP
jgi:cellulose synthase operon protein C